MTNMWTAASMENRETVPRAIREVNELKLAQTSQRYRLWESRKEVNKFRIKKLVDVSVRVETSGRKPSDVLKEDDGDHRLQ